jgi:phenylpropionate dioxygenase-like ring-hydroxylating dioxygenase large terminal subunit
MIGMSAAHRMKSFAELDFAQFPMRIATDRYTSSDFQQRERETIWMRVWQVAGRVDELPRAGDWKEYRIFDQSYLIVRGKDGKLRGFVNACRHRGNLLCQGGKGNTPRFTCRYHLWTYGLDGRLLGVARPDLVGPIDKNEHALVQVPVDSFSGFMFINPDPNAGPLADFLGREVIELLAPYHLEEMVPVMDVREALDCNWKVVMDAFSEGYHIEGIHPQLLQVIVLDAAKNRFGFFGDHAVAVAPFEVRNVAGFGAQQEIEGIRQLPATFPGVAAVLPAFEKLVASYCNEDGAVRFAEGITGRKLLQQATRSELTLKGLDVSALSDDQMSDNQGWFLFPNFMMTVRAGEAHVIMSVPHPDGDPNRCIWHVSSYMYLPERVRAQCRANLIEVQQPGSYPYFLALQQDYEQMPRQQLGLRNRMLKHLSLAREEVNIARFHSIIDRYLQSHEDIRIPD